MKKLGIAIILGVMSLSLFGCKQTNPNGPTEVIPGGVVGESEEATTPVEIFAKDFEEKMNSGESTAPEDMAAALISNPSFPYAGATMAVEEGYLNGFTEEIKGFTSGAVFGPSIGSIPFIGYVFKVDGDAQAFADHLEEVADLRWNVCTSADEMKSVVHDDTVLFIMAPATFEEE